MESHKSREIREISFTQSVRNVFPEMTVPIILRSDNRTSVTRFLYYSWKSGETGKYIFTQYYDVGIQIVWGSILNMNT